jgi:pilus assembly protein FimV
MYRKLASVILVASAINAKYVYALGLGEMTMLSSLDEPLNAEIQLRNTDDLDPNQIIVTLADEAQFINAGIDKTFFLANLRFNVVTDNKGNGVVKLSSQKPVKEPFFRLFA